MKKMLAVALTALLVFCGVAVAEVGMVNPWQETTAEGLMDSLGVTLGVPDGATDVSYRMMEQSQLGEMTFSWYDMDYTARVAPTDGFEDISGVYIEWNQSMDCSVGRCAATDSRGPDGEDTVELCLWYDELTGLMYSLCVSAPDLDGFDILAAADQVYVPMQTE